MWSCGLLLVSHVLPFLVPLGRRVRGRAPGATRIGAALVCNQCTLQQIRMDRGGLSVYSVCL